MSRTGKSRQGEHLWQPGLAVLAAVVLTAVVVASALAACGEREDAEPPAESTPAGDERTEPAPQAASRAVAGEFGLVSEVVVADIAQPTDFAFAPDGRIFVAAKDGTVHVVRDGTLLAEPFVELPANDYHERGLLGLALDPDFEQNGYVYLYYVHDAAFYAEPSGERVVRLIRLTADGDRARPGSEVVLLGGAGGDAQHPSCTDLPVQADCLPADGLSHIGGALVFAPDGTLFVGTGEASFLTQEPDRTRARAQQLDSLAGKLLRINADGTAPSDNPFFNGDPQANRSKVWAYGLRNPFRVGLQPGTDLPFVGDVGSAFWEEVNVAKPGANFGWPCYEGPEMNDVHAALPFCQSFLAEDHVVEQPVHAYPVAHLEGSAVIGGVFYEGTEYPPELQGAYIFGDWVDGSVRAFNVDAQGQLAQGSVRQLFSDAGQPVAFEIGPSGDVYYLTFDPSTGVGEVRRIRYRGT